VTIDPAALSLAARGDLSALSPAEKARHYVATCERLGLNPHTAPFQYLRLNGKEVLYATRGATDQLAALHNLNREILDGPKVIDLAGTKLVYCVCKVTLPNGRFETATATVPLVDPVNALMRAETKGKRRATLSILGLAPLDETVADTAVDGGSVISAEDLDRALAELHGDPKPPTGGGGGGGGAPPAATDVAGEPAPAPATPSGALALLDRELGKLPTTSAGALRVARTWWSHREAFVGAGLVEEGEAVVFAALRTRGVADVETFLTEAKDAPTARKSLARTRRPEGGILVQAVGS
jgi:hypothetical protein